MDWKGRRFAKVPGDENEFIPLPEVHDLFVMQCWSKVFFGKRAKLIRNGAGMLQRD